MQQSVRISLIATLAIAIGVMMIPGVGMIPAAYASSHHNHHHHHHNHHHHGHHHHQHGHHSSISVRQGLNQANLCDSSTCSNTGSNSASISSGHHGASNIKVGQSLNQLNACKNNSHCTNTGTNTANIS